MHAAFPALFGKGWETRSGDCMRYWQIALVGLVGCTGGSDRDVTNPPASSLSPSLSTGPQAELTSIDTVGQPWRTDPALRGRFHPQYPDDLQVIVHDGGPRLTKATPELMWVTVLGNSGRVYRGKLLNEPHQLISVKQGDEILFLSGSENIEPFRVTAKYLQEREHWHVLPCNKCGMSELFDAPSDLIAAIFPGLRDQQGVQEIQFTSFCPLCSGVQFVSDKPIDAAELE